jgi:AcrR family transcriptional regulator
LRILKSYDERRDELLDAAEKLFLEKGYEQASVNDIIEAVGVAKGTFYYYFDGKEELLDALGERRAEQLLSGWNEVIADKKLSAVEKLNLVFQTLARVKAASPELVGLLVKKMYGEQNEHFRRKMTRRLIDIALADLARVVEQGVREGTLDTAYPRQAVRLILTLGDEMMEGIAPFVGDGGQGYHPEHVEEHYRAYEQAMERILGAESGSLRFFDRRLLPEA